MGILFLDRTSGLPLVEIPWFSGEKVLIDEIEYGVQILTE